MIKYNSLKSIQERGNPIYGISLGAGEPDLITVKGLKILQKSDYIFYPVSHKIGKEESITYRMLKHHKLPSKKLQRFVLKMSDDRSKVEDVYENTTQKIITLQQQNKKIALVCEGDLSFFATFGYFLPFFKNNSVPFEMVSGVSSPNVAAATHKIPLGLWQDKIAIIPKMQDIEELSEYLKNFETVVLLKIRSIWTSLRPQL